jgi:hypothetical protein
MKDPSGATTSSAPDGFYPIATTKNKVEIG